MEMCYDGALVMPSSFAVMDEEEMTYVEGGKKKYRLSVTPFVMAIDISIALLGGYNISAIGNLSCYAVKKLIKKNWKKIGNRALEAVATGVTGALSSLIGSVSLTMSVITSATSIGGLVGLFMDATDKKLDGKFTFYA